MKIKSQRLFLSVFIALQAGWYIALWIGYYTYPKTLERSDFVCFYTAGRIAQSAGFSSIYDLNMQHEWQQQISGKPIATDAILPFNRPPFLAPILSIVSNTNYRVSYLRWEFTLTIFLAAAFFFGGKIARDNAPNGVSTRGVFILGALFYPIFVSVLKGQDTAFLLLGAFIWMYGALKGDDHVSGLGLALTLIKPQIGLFLSIPHAIRRFGVARWYILASSALALYAFLLVGSQGTQRFVDAVIISARGKGYGKGEEATFNLIGAILRAFPSLELDLVHAMGWAAYIAAIFAVSLVWLKSQSVEVKHIGLSAIAGAFFSPHLHSHDLGLLFLPVIGTAVILAQKRRWNETQIALFVSAVSISMLLSDISSFRYITVYALFAGLTYFLWFPEKVFACFEKTTATDG